MVLSVFPICIWEQCHLAMIDCLSAAMLLQVFPGLASFQCTAVATFSAITSIHSPISKYCSWSFAFYFLSHGFWVFQCIFSSSDKSVILSVSPRWCNAGTLLGVRIANSLNFQTNFVSGYMKTLRWRETMTYTQVLIYLLLWRRMSHQKPPVRLKSCLLPSLPCWYCCILPNCQQFKARAQWFTNNGLRRPPCYCCCCCCCWQCPPHTLQCNAAACCFVAEGEKNFGHGV